MKCQAKTKKRKYASIIFDLDGTILDRPSTVPREANLAALKLLCPMRYDIATLEDELKRVYALTTHGGGFLVPKRKQFTLLLKNLGIFANNLVEKLFQEFQGRYLSLVDLFPDALKTLTTLSGLRARARWRRGCNYSRDYWSGFYSCRSVTAYRPKGDQLISHCAQFE